MGATQGRPCNFPRLPAENAVCSHYFHFLKIPAFASVKLPKMFTSLFPGRQVELNFHGIIIFNYVITILFCAKIVLSKDQMVYPTQEARRQWQGDPSACFPCGAGVSLAGHLSPRGPRGTGGLVCLLVPHTAAAFFCLELRRKYLRTTARYWKSNRR